MAGSEDRKEAPKDTPIGPEREFETGKDEAWFANVKRTYDVYEKLISGLFTSSDANTLRGQGNSLDFDKSIQAQMLALTTTLNQHISNSVETANMVGKMATIFQGLGYDKGWNVDERDAYVKTIIDRLASSAPQNDALFVLLARALGIKDEEAAE